LDGREESEKRSVGGPTEQKETKWNELGSGQQKELRRDDCRSDLV